MNLTITIPDDTLKAWQFDLDNYNKSGTAKPLTLEQYVDQIVVGGKTESNVTAFNAAQIESLVPLGEKYLAAPKKVQEQVDTLLDPYAKPAKVVAP